MLHVVSFACYLWCDLKQDYLVTRKLPVKNYGKFWFGEFMGGFVGGEGQGMGVERGVACMAYSRQALPLAMALKKGEVDSPSRKWDASVTDL